MKMNIPEYVEKGKKYFADTCIPVVKAARLGTLELVSLARGSYPGKKLFENELPGIKSIGYWNSKCKQDWGLAEHRNEGIEFTYLSNGTLPFSVGKNDYILQPDNLTITRPWQPHRVGNPIIGINKLYFLILDVGVRRPHQGWEWPEWIILTEPDLEELTLMLRQCEQHVWHGNQAIRDCFYQIGEFVRNKENGSSMSKLTILVNELLLLFLEMFRNCEFALNESLTSVQRSVKLFLKDLRSNLYEPWDIHTMAEECKIGITSFVNYCKVITNMTPMQYLLYLRIEQAAQLLIEKPLLNVIDIAMDCGFSSSQYFARCFKKITGLTPSEYRLKHIQPDQVTYTESTA